MPVFRRLGGQVIALALPVALLGVVWFFSLQAFTGHYGHIALDKTKRDLATAERQLAMLTEREDALRKRNAGLSAGAVDLDLLDERARDVLGMIGREDVFLIAH